MNPDIYQATTTGIQHVKSGKLTSQAEIAQGIAPPLTDRLEATINDMIDTAGAILSSQDNTFGRLFGFRPEAAADSIPPDPPSFSDRISLKLQRLQATLLEVQRNAVELSNKL